MNYCSKEQFLKQAQRNSPDGRWRLEGGVFGRCPTHGPQHADGAARVLRGRREHLRGRSVVRVGHWHALMRLIFFLLLCQFTKSVARGVGQARGVAAAPGRKRKRQTPF
jgi:hypothetical protein